MAKQRRIPEILAAFIAYITTVNDYLQNPLPGESEPRGKTLGMTGAELTKLADYVKLFMSGDPAHPGLWDLHKNKDTKTASTRQNMADAMKEFGIFFRPILNRMASCTSITNNDRNVLNIAHPITTHTTPSTAIAAKCFVDITMLGQCEVKFECRASADANRSGKAEGSDAVEVAFCSLPMVEVKAGDGSILASKVKPRQMMGPSEATDHSISTKALFTVTYPDSQLGNNLQLFFRWINTKHPDLAGPWSPLFSVIIS
jgi:hypothetical protein